MIEWSQIDLERSVAWIHPDQAKGKKAIPVPLNEEALQVIEQQKGKHDKYVFIYKDKPVWQVNTKAWRKAVKEVELGEKLLCAGSGRDFDPNQITHSRRTSGRTQGTQSHNGRIQ